MTVGATRAVGLGGRARALLAVVALSPGRAAERRVLAATLWPASANGRRLAALRQTLRGASAALVAAGFDGLRADRDIVRLDPDRVAVDLEQIVRCAARGLAHRRLLEGPDPFSRFEAAARSAGAGAWAAERAAALKAEAATLISAALAAADDPVVVRDLARAALVLDPCDEPAARRLMEAEAASGAPHRAIDCFDRLWRALDAAHGEEPCGMTQSLLERIRAGATPRLGRLGAADRSADAGQSALSPSDVLGAERAAAAPIPAGLEGVRPTEERTARVADQPAIRLPPAAPMGPEVAGALPARADASATSAPRLGSGDAALEPEDARWRLRALVERMTPDALARLQALSAAPGARRAEGFDALALALGDALAGRPADAARRIAARDAAEAAADADPLDPAARRAIGWSRLFDGEQEAARAAFALAAHLDPSGAAGLREAALGLALSGAAEDSRALLAEAEAIAPAGPDAGLGLIWMTAAAMGDWADPVFSREDAGAAPLARAWRAAALCDAGTDAEAARRAVGLPIGWAEAAARALPIADADRREALAARLAEAERRAAAIRAGGDAGSGEGHPDA